MLSYVWLFVTLWAIALQAPLSSEYSIENTGVGCHFLLQETLLTQESNPDFEPRIEPRCVLHLLHWQADSFYFFWQADSLPLCHLGSPTWRPSNRNMDCKEIQPVNPKGDQSWLFTGRTDAEAETPILWLPDSKSWLIWKDPDAGKDWRQEEKGMTEDEMAGWHHQLNGHEFE